MESIKYNIFTGTNPSFNFIKTSCVRRLRLVINVICQKKNMKTDIYSLYHLNKFKIGSIYYNRDFFFVAFFNRSNILNINCMSNELTENKQNLQKKIICLSVIGLVDLFSFYKAIKNNNKYEFYNQKSIINKPKILLIFEIFYFTNFRCINFYAKNLLRFSLFGSKKLNYRIVRLGELFKTWCKNIYKKKRSSRHVNLDEGLVFVSTGLVFSYERIFTKISEITSTSTYIIKNIFAVAEVCDIIYSKMYNIAIFFSKFFDALDNKTNILFRDVNFKLKYYLEKKKKPIYNVNFFTLEYSWTLILNSYCKNLYYQFKEERFFSPSNKQNASNKSIFLPNIDKTKIPKPIKIYFRKMKGLLYKYCDSEIIWIRLIAENFFLNEIVRLSEFLFFWTNRNLVTNNAESTKRLLILSELICGGCSPQQKTLITTFKGKFSDKFISIGLKRIPGKTEKIYSWFDLSKNSNIIDIDICKYYYSLGYVDLARKNIQKMIFYSSGNNHLNILKNWLNIEYHEFSINIGRSILFSLLNNKASVKIEFSLLLKKLYNSNWNFFIKDLKIFLEFYKDLKITREVYIKLVC
nr:hypothetical protein 1634Bnrm2_p114 [Cryptomonas sp.]